MLHVLGSLALGPGPGDGELLAVPPRLRRLLAVLAVDAGAVVRADRLVELLWPRDPPGDAHAALQTLVSRLRRLLAGDPAVELLTRPPGYLLQLADGGSDTARFEQELRAGRQLLPGDPQAAAEHLAGALALWRGPAYAEFADEEFARAEAARLEELREAAEEDLVDAWVTCGRVTEAIARLEVLRAAAPLRERRHSQFMRALHAAGRTADALQVYHDWRRTLDDELGLEPTPQLRDLHQRLLRGELPRPVRAAQPDAGEQDALIGRERLCERLATALASARVVSLTGPGGVGKTSLARWAARAEAAAGRTVWWCDLAPVRTGAVADKVLTVLRAQPRPAMTAREAVADVLRPSTGLLVLDNAEHVVDEAARLVAGVVVGCPRVGVLLTSRERVGAPGEHLVVVPPLDLPAGGGTVRTAAVELFLRRAAEVSPGFPADGDLAVVAELCRRLDGLPLALELAAARMRSMTPAELAGRLSWRFRVLRGGPRAEGDRHRSLRALVDWSHDLLDERARRVLARLSVFTGTFTLADAEAVVPAGGAGVDAADVADAVADLVDRSMVTAHRGPRGSRYDQLETLRLYGRERLAESGEGPATARAHAERQLAAAGLAAGGLYGPDNAAWAAELDDRLDDLRAAHAWALEHDQVLAGHLVVVLMPYAEQRMVGEVFHWADRTLEALRRSGPATAEPGEGGSGAAPDRGPVLGALLGVAALGARSRGQLDAADALAREGLQVAGGPSRPGATAALCALSDVAIFSGDPAAAVRRAEQLLALPGAQDSNLHQVLGPANLLLGRLYGGDRAGTVRDAGALLRRAERQGRPVLAAWMSYVLAEALGDQTPDRAIAAAESALASARALDERFLTGVALVTTASLQARHGSLPRAVEVFVEVVDHWHRAGNWTQQWIALRSCVGLLARAGAVDDAAVLLGALTGRATATLPYGADAERLHELGRALSQALGPGVAESRRRRGAAMTDTEVLVWLRAALTGRPASPGR